MEMERYLVSSDFPFSGRPLYGLALSQSYFGDGGVGFQTVGVDISPCVCIHSGSAANRSGREARSSIGGKAQTARLLGDHIFGPHWGSPPEATLRMRVVKMSIRTA